MLVQGWMWARSVWRGRIGSLALLTILVAAVGGVTMGTAAGARRADSAFERFVRATGEPDLIAQADFDSGRIDFDLAERSIEVFQQATAVAGVEAARAAAVWVLTPGAPLEPWQFGVVRQTEGGDGTFVVDGRLAANDRADEVTVNEAAARALAVGVGDQLVLSTAAREQLAEWATSNGYVETYQGPQIPVTVVGITRGIEEIAQAEDTTISMTPAFFDTYAGEVLHCTCFVLFSVDDDQLDASRAEIERIYRPLGFVVEPLEDGQLPEQAAEGIGIEVVSLWILAAITALAGTLLIGQAFARQLSDSSAADGTRRALGATMPQIARSSIAVLTPVVVAGAGGATAIAVTLSPLFPQGLARQAEIDPGLDTDATVLTLGVVAMLLVGMALAAIAARWAAAPQATPSGRLARLPNLVSSPARRLGVAFALRPGRRGRAALWSGVIATTVAAAGVVGVGTYEASRARVRETPALFGMNADLVTGVGGVSTAVDELLAVVEADGVRAAAIRYSSEVEVPVRSESGSLDTVFEATESRGDRVGPTVVEGRLPEGPAEVALGRGPADVLGVAVGDSIEVGPDDAATTFTVVGEIVSWGNDEVVNGVQVTLEGLEQIVAFCTDAGCRASPLTAMVRLEDGPGGDTARASLLADGWTEVPLPSVVSNVDQAGPIPVAMGAMLALMGVGALTHALAVTLHRRGRDVAIARSLGLGPAGSRSSLRWNALVIVGIGVAIGVPLGLVVGRVAWNRIAGRIGVVVEHALPWWVAIAVAMVLFGVGLTVAEILARRAGRRHTAAVLRAE